MKRSHARTTRDTKNTANSALRAGVNHAAVIGPSEPAVYRSDEKVHMPQKATMSTMVQANPPARLPMRSATVAAMVAKNTDIMSGTCGA